MAAASAQQAVKSLEFVPQPIFHHITIFQIINIQHIYFDSNPSDFPVEIRKNYHHDLKSSSSDGTAWTRING